MSKKVKAYNDSKTLRKQAEEKVPPESTPLQEMENGDVAALVHELRVHEVELQMQNESLREAQVQLEESRTKYADLFDFAPVGYLVTDSKGVIREVNLIAAGMLGVERAQVIDKPFKLFLTRASSDPWRLHYTAIFKKGQSQETELEIRHPADQPATFVRVRSRSVENGAGKVVQCRTAMIDITARVRAERRLRESERRFRTLAENSPDVITRVDRQMRVHYVNKPIEAALGIAPGEFVGKTFEELGIPEDLCTLWTGAIAKVFKTARPNQADFECAGPEGVRHYSATVVPEFGEDRVFDTVLVTVRDITARVRAEEKYSTVIHSLQNGFCIVDHEGRYLEVNETCCRMLGRSCEELLRLTVRDVWEPEQQEELAGHFQKALKDGWDKFEMSHRRKDGSRIDCDVTMQRLNGDRLFVFAHDVTRQRVAEQQRLGNLQRFEMVARAANDGIWDWDLAGDTCWHNETFAQAFGYTTEEVQGPTDWWRQRVHPDDRDGVLSTLEAALQNGTDMWSARYRFRRKDGSYAWVMDRGYMIRDGGGRAVRMVGSTMDLTEKLALIDQLESERAKLGTILDTALSGIIVVDKRGGLVYANAAAQKLHGQPMPLGEGPESHGLMGLYHLDGTPCDPEDLPVVRAARYGETHNKAELLVRVPDGPTRHIMFNASPLKDRDGKVTGGVAVIQDITELKAAEEDLRQARDELEQKIRERTADLDATVETLHQEVADRIEVQDRLARQNDMLQRIIDNVPVMLCFFDAEGHIGLVNNEFTRVLGYTVEDFREQNLTALADASDRERQAFRDHMMTQEPWWRDFAVRTKDGEAVLSSWATAGMPDGSYVGIGIDIRQRREFEDRLRESEERYRTLVELSPDAIGVERDGILQFVNTTTVKLLGARRDEDLVGRPVLDLVHPDYRARAERQFQSLRKRRPLPPSEDRLQRLDGTAVDVELAAMPIIFEGRPASQIVFRDITQRKQVETRLQENARQLQQQAELLNLAHDSIVVNDMEGRVIFWNHGAEQTYGWTREEAIGQISHDLLQTRFPANLIEITARLLSQGRWNGELTHTTKSGRTIIVSSRWALQRTENSLPTGILVIDRDVTQQKRAEQASIEARQFAESITDTVQEALLVLDRGLKVVSANQTFYRTFEVTPEETRDRYIYEIGNGQWDIPELRTLLEDILPHDTSFEDFEVEHNFEQIGRRTMLLNARRVYRQEQETELILLAIQDITIRKDQEKKIREHQQELASLTEELLLAEERERHRIALVLHDSIGQSLSFSKRELGVLKKKSPETVRAELEYVKEQIELAIRQTRDLTFELSPTTLHTFGLEAGVEELVEQLAARENLQYHFEATDEDKPLSEQIRTLLYRAARELLVNIIKHAKATNVSIHIDRQDRNVRMIVADDGQGFDVSQLERADHQQEGFGLFSIRERLTYVGGKFAIESEPGKGTKVTLVAPLSVPK